MKKTAFVAVLALVLGCAALPAFADTGQINETMALTYSDDSGLQAASVQPDPIVIDEGDFGINGTLHWEYWDDKKLVISGSGEMEDYAKDGGQPWNAHLRHMTAVIIEDGVTNIGAYAFYECDYLTSMDVGNAVVAVGEYAFYGCDALQTMRLPDGVLDIGTYAFAGCSSLKECHLSTELTAIPDYLFYDCRKLSKVNIPSQTVSIGEYAFSRCLSLEGVVFRKR